VLLSVTGQLSAELGYSEGEELPDWHSELRPEKLMAGILDSEEEALVAALRRALAGLAFALGAGEGEEVNEGGVSATLDGIEMVIRVELMGGKGAQLPALLPGFVFLVALSVVGQDRALELSRRSAKLIERCLGPESESSDHGGP
jgi:hypothetical protein